jgi:hypothetical protein
MERPAVPHLLEEGRAGPKTYVSRRTALAGLMALLAAPAANLRGWAEQRRGSTSGRVFPGEVLRRGPLYASIVYAPQGISIGDLIRGLVLIHPILDAEERVGQLELL